MTDDFDYEDDEQDDTSWFQPSTHYYKRFWKYFLLLMSPVIATLMVWGIIEILGNYRAGKGWENIWLLAFILLTLGGLAVLMLVGMVMVLRSRIVLELGKLEYRGLFHTLNLTPEMIEGFRINNGQFLLFIHGTKWPINLSYYDQQPALHNWLRYFSVSLDELDRRREAEEISQDAKLGENEAQRHLKLESLRQHTRTLNWFAYITAVAAFINFAFWKIEIVHQLAVTLMVMLPVLMLFLAVRNPGYVKFDSREWSTYPEVFSGWAACSMSIALISLYDEHTLLGDGIYQWIFILTMICCAIFLMVEGKNLLQMFKKQLIVALFAMAGYIFIASYWVGGSVYQINILLDVSPVQWNQSSVTAVRARQEKVGHTYYLKLASRDMLNSGDVEIQVSKQDYANFKTGDGILLGERGGWLGLPWIDQVRPLRF